MKKVIALILAVMMLSSLGVFASADYENIPEMTLLYDTTCTEASTSGQGALITVKEIEEMTGGKVKVDKYDNYSLYPQDQIIPAVMSGELAMSATTAAYMADYMPKLSVLGSAYLFSSFKHWHDYYNSEEWLALTDEIAETLNIRVLGISNKGGRTINLIKDQKVLHRSDLAGIPLRMPNSEAWLFLGEALGRDFSENQDHQGHDHRRYRCSVAAVKRHKEHRRYSGVGDVGNIVAHENG